MSQTQWIRSLRSPKRPVDPREPLGHVWEEERERDGRLLPALTIFLAGAECPFTCVFCDLWRETLNSATPPASLPIQIRKALSAVGPPSRPAAIKLYNASNFFEPRAVPPQDEAEILDLVAPFSRVTVECHPRLIGDRCLRFAERLAGSLEVAMGLETIHPQALARLNKEMTLADFDRAAAILRTAGIGLRAFVLLAPPFTPPDEAVDWAVRSAQHAFEQGAARVSLIPVRGGNGAMEALRDSGDFTPPRLEQLEEALERSLSLDGIVTADLWDARRFAHCPECADARIARLDRMNRTGHVEPKVACVCRQE
ncbi:MAG TPA: radical SAM protein [Thermoanaerobaculia bacterium]|nr:radical SAM protein [Thermoanaerobaculia bacterium]